MKPERGGHKLGIKYAKDIVSGKIFVAEDTVLSCKRFLAELQRTDWDYFFHSDSVDHFLWFSSHIQHVKGADSGQRFVLEPYQIMVACNILGFLHKETYRRLRQDVIILIPRKSGKSTLVSLLCLYFLIFPNGHASEVISEKGVEVLCTACDRTQAKIVFTSAQAMLEKMPPNLARKYKLMRDSIHAVDDRLSIFTTLSQDSKKNALGMGCSLHVIDEAAIVPSANINVVNSGMLHRPSPLRIYISTAHFSRESLFFDHLSYCQNMLRGLVPDNQRWYYLGFMLPEGVEWTDPKGWYAAQPMLNKTLPLDAYEHMCREAQDKIPLRGEFLTRNLNVWTTSGNAIFDFKDFDNLPAGMPEGVPDAIAVGLDLAYSRDLNAVAILKRFGNEYWLEVKSFLPEDSFGELSAHLVPIFQKAIASGEVVLTNGNVIDIEHIFNHLVHLAEANELTVVGFDPWNSLDLQLRVKENTSLVMEKVGQSIGSMSAPCKEFYKLVKERRIHMVNSPFFTWCATNVSLYEDANNNWKFTKENADNKIDPIIATVIALKVLMDRPSFSGGGFFIL